MTFYSSEDTEFIKPQVKKYPVRISIQHWQLRDLLACPSNRNEFIYSNERSVLMYNTTEKRTTTIFRDMSFSPSSLSAGCGYLAAGGQRSQLIVRNLSNNWFAQISVGGSINNAMSISNHLGSTRLLVCNNDETIKVYNLPSLQRITNISLPVAVNYVSVSPDGKKMVAVGDSNQVFLYDISPTGGYQKISTLTASSDASFSCAWNQSSEKFAVASQDGCVSVWDVRSSEKLAKITSKQYPQVKGACRSVKFSPSGPVDLLMFSEHVSYINLVDTRNFSEVQSIRVAPPENDQHISGVSFSPDSSTIFVGLETAVYEYQVNVMARRCFPDGTLN
ncbi:WD40-repeat-containing domain protein [Polychytrium aggregatum]|uniref:WD40-repeat-containing domain protein n=1 Tax=Polychytrium aggregatum TaxID=110093 RepID=UPI0022FDFE27|nr:WD40-repeat-containing domain protein [Polychytrium aggregatum]KAI9208721.1 WD40-repeat-containing domain protein [Polychytrium aggregatum]